MLAFDVNLQQSWCGEELLALATLMELQICECERKGAVERIKDGRATVEGTGLVAEDPRSTQHLPSVRNPCLQSSVEPTGKEQ